MLRLRFYLAISEPNISPGPMHVCSPLCVVLAEAHPAVHIPPCPQLARLSSLVCQQPGYVHCIWKCMHLQTHVSTELASVLVVLHRPQHISHLLQQALSSSFTPSPSSSLSLSSSSSSFSSSGILSTSYHPLPTPLSPSMLPHLKSIICSMARSNHSVEVVGNQCGGIGRSPGSSPLTLQCSCHQTNKATVTHRW